MSPQAHQFTTIVQARSGQLEADEWLATHGRPHPRRRHLTLGYDWELRNVSTGQTVAAGEADDEEDAEDQAAEAKQRAEDADAARVRGELGIPAEA